MFCVSVSVRFARVTARASNRRSFLSFVRMRCARDLVVVVVVLVDWSDSSIFHREKNSSRRAVLFPFSRIPELSLALRPSRGLRRVDPAVVRSRRGPIPWCTIFLFLGVFFLVFLFARIFPAEECGQSEPERSGAERERWTVYRRNRKYQWKECVAWSDRILGKENSLKKVVWWCPPSFVRKGEKVSKGKRKRERET